MLIVRVLLLILVLAIGFAWSSEPKKPPSKNGYQQTKTEQTGAENAPLFVKGDVTTKQDKTEAERDAEERKHKARVDAALVEYTRWLALLTGCLFFAAVAQVGLFVWQLRLMRKATENAGAAARAAFASAKASNVVATTAREEFLATHRPKLILQDAFCDDTEFGHPIAVKYVIVNIGETPARIIESAIEIKVITTEGDGFGAHPRITIQKGQNEIGDVKINAGEGLERTFNSKSKWNADSRRDVLEPNLGVFFCGHFAYEDDQKIKRHTLFWRRYDFGESRFYRRKTRVIDALDSAH